MGKLDTQRLVRRLTGIVVKHEGILRVSGPRLPEYTRHAYWLDEDTLTVRDVVVVDVLGDHVRVATVDTTTIKTVKRINVFAEEGEALGARLALECMMQDIAAMNREDK